MADEKNAASSAAEVADVFNGEQVSFSEFNNYRESGEVPERFRVTPQSAEDAESAAADALEEPTESESASASEAEEEAQEPSPKGSGAQKRIKQLLAEKKELARRLEEAQHVNPARSESLPAAHAEAQPASLETRPKPTVDDKTPDGKPKYANYDAFVEDLADWKGEQQLARYRREAAEQEALKALKVKVDEARARYEDADAVILPTGNAINKAEIPAAVKAVFGESDLFLDLCYVVGSDPEELESFIALARQNPRAAIAKVFDYERAIREEFAGNGSEDNERGEAPEKRLTQAPKPPSPVGGGSSRAFDVSDESLSPEEWARKRTQDLSRRGSR